MMTERASVVSFCKRIFLSQQDQHSPGSRMARGAMNDRHLPHDLADAQPRNANVLTATVLTS
jgi:hypothetical protein